MKKCFTVAIIGAGSRGYAYSSLMKEIPEKFKVTAICDINPQQIVKLNSLWNLPEEALFEDENEFFKEKRADVLVVATWDKNHVRQTIKAMELGYDVLLEKPVSDSEEELKQLLCVQQKTGKKIVVCHVLRYGPGYRKMYELLQKGTIGKLLTIDATERVVYWHWAQAYVRIQSEANDIAHPTILAKCCHDLDYIQYYAGSSCDTVSSVGGLDFFKEENAPENSTERCVDCPHINTCPFSAKHVYIDLWKKRGCPEFEWPFYKVSLKNPNTEEDLYKGIESTYFGKCVFRCNIDTNINVVDNQMLQMRFANGVNASLKMVFAGNRGRKICLYGTYGEIVFDSVPDTIEVNVYGKEKEIISVEALIGDDSAYSHGGGDKVLISELYSILTGEAQNHTSLTESIESHLIGIKAEQSRLNGGIVLKVH